MSVLEMKMFTVICDNCKKSADEGSGYAAWNDESYAKEVADEAGYAKNGDLHYCPDCHYYDDDDNLMVRISKENNESAK